MSTATGTAQAETHVVDVRVGPQSKPKEPAVERPAKPGMTINARPAAALAGSTTLVTGATIFAAAGPVGLVVAGVTVAAAGAGAVALKARSNRKATGSIFDSGRKAAKGRDGASSAGPSKSGASRAGTPSAAGKALAARAAAAGGSPPARRGTRTSVADGTKPGAPGSRSAGTPGASRSATGSTGMLGKLRQLGGALRSNPTKATKATKSGTPDTGSVTAERKKPSNLGKVARAAGRGLAAPFRAAGNAKGALGATPTGRTAAKNARSLAQRRAASRGNKPRWWRGWGSALLALGAGGIRSGWKRAFRKKPGAKPVATPVAKVPTAPSVGTTLRGPTSAVGPAVVKQAPIPVPAAGPPVPLPGAPTPIDVPTSGGTMSAMRQMLECAEQMKAIAAKYNPVGIMEVIDEYALMPEVLRTVAGAIRIMHTIANHPTEGYPLKPVVIDLIDSVHRNQIGAAKAADMIATTARTVHREDIDKLSDIRNRMWDQRANQGNL